MQHLEVSGAVGHIYIYIYDVRRLKVKLRRLIITIRRETLHNEKFYERQRRLDTPYVACGDSAVNRLETISAMEIKLRVLARGTLQGSEKLTKASFCKRTTDNLFPSNGGSNIIK